MIPVSPFKIVSSVVAIIGESAAYQQGGWCRLSLIFSLDGVDDIEYSQFLQLSVAKMCQRFFIVRLSSKTLLLVVNHSALLTRRWALISIDGLSHKSFLIGSECLLHLVKLSLDDLKLANFSSPLLACDIYRQDLLRKT